MNKKEKEEKYKKIIPEIFEMIKDEKDIIALLSTVSCELFHAFEHWNWVGFYRRVDKKTLKVGPYQGGHGCLTIDIERGVCGSCVRKKSILIINDVSKEEGHIACSSVTQSEMVLPIISNSGSVMAVFDIDSTQISAFDSTDQVYLSRLVDWIRPIYEQQTLHDWESVPVSEYS